VNAGTAHAWQIVARHLAGEHVHPDVLHLAAAHLDAAAHKRLQAGRRRTVEEWREVAR
jgi:hypothetical protein